MNTNNETSTPTSIYRPKQVLLIGLGGVGGRVVNAIMSKVPAEFKPYTQAVAIDTDLGEIKQLQNIPVENHITLGANTTVGKYMRDNPDVGDWMVRGNQLDLIRSRNTKNGAKQIRMVSRIALRATNSQGHLGKRIEHAINKLNTIDGKTEGSGLLVLVVCSIAGGTGAGTVIQVPIYLEEAIKNAYDSDNVQFECAMLMPNAFSTTLSTENYKSAKVNGYAVLRELMSLNTGRMRRFEYFEANEVDITDERCAPYGRVMLFDNKNGKGETITGAVDTVHAPLMADALTEYLFGPANGKITSALDNTLKAVYDSNGGRIFGAVGKADLLFPRVLYKQYCVANWIDSALSGTWLLADEEAKRNYREAVKAARKNGEPKPDESESIRTSYNDFIREQDSIFFNDIRRQLGIIDDQSYESLAKEYWDNVVADAKDQLINCESINQAHGGATLSDDFTYRRGKGLDAVKTRFFNLYSTLMSQKSKIPSLAREYLQPLKARSPKFFKDDTNTTHIYTFIKNHKLHPVALRYFLYTLYNILNDIEKKVTLNPNEMTQGKWDSYLKEKRSRTNKVNHLRDEIRDDAKLEFTYLLSQEMLHILSEMIHEIEDLFYSILKVKEFFCNSSKECLLQIDRLNDKADTVVVGSALSMINCWNVFNSKIHLGEEGEEDIIDDSLSLELAKVVYQNFFRHVDSETTTTVTVGDDTLRIPTDYTNIIRTKLQSHFMNKLTHTYGNFFPENIVEAVKYDCGVKNFWNVLNATNKNVTTAHLNCADPTNPDHYNRAAELNLKVFDHIEVLNLLLSHTIGKAEPRCGFVNFPDGEGYTNRLMVMNKGILQQTTKFGDEDSEIIEVAEDLTCIIPGVSTSIINGISVSPNFKGNSVDKITCITTYAALEPHNFVALLAPDSDENAPQDAMGYYKPYRDYITEVVTDPTKITPHLDRRWHLTDKLADITPSHTHSVWKHAAKAFVHGFIYNLIQVSDNGEVVFGADNDKHFIGIDKRGKFTLDFISPAEQAVLANPATSASGKKDILNAILNKIFERLANDPVLSSAIIEYAEEQIADDRLFSKANFIKKASETELRALSIYLCIFDVIDGYYNGSYRAKHIEKDFAKDTTRYMFEVVITTIFMQISSITNAAYNVKDVCYKAIDLIYKKAVCVDIPNSTTTKKKVTIKDKYATDAEAQSDLDALLGIISNPATAASTTKPFSSGGDCDFNNACNIIDQLMRESVE